MGIPDSTLALDRYHLGSLGPASALLPHRAEPEPHLDGPASNTLFSLSLNTVLAYSSQSYDNHNNGQELVSDVCVLHLSSTLQASTRARDSHQFTYMVSEWISGHEE